MQPSSLRVLAALAVFTLPPALAAADPASGSPGEPAPALETIDVTGSVRGSSELTSISPGIAVDSGSRRGVAHDYLVMPSGGELTGSMHFVTTDQPALGAERLRFSDLALLELAGRYSVIPRLEVSGQLALVPKQPAASSEKVWQSAGIGLRTPLAERAAIAIGAGGGHLLDHPGSWETGSLLVQWRKPISDFVQFETSGGGQVTDLRAPRSTSAQITELAVAGSVVFHDNWHWGGWVGIGYAVPVDARGTDPTTGLAVDPRPRLDLKLGAVLAVSRAWDVFAEFAVVDRGDLGAPATRLPILDGGFDQQQIVLGVTRHLETARSSESIAAR